VYNGPPNGAIPVVSSVEIIPDAVGGVVAVSDHISASSKVQRHLNRIANGTVLQHQVDDEDHVAVTSKEGPLFLQNVFGESVAAVDPVGGGELWRVSDPNYQMLPIAALAGGHVLVLESTLDQSESRIVDVDSSGAITMTQTVDLQQNLTPVSLYNDGVVGVDSTGNITEVALPTYLERTYASFNAGQVGPRPIRIVTFIPDVQGTGNLGTRANGDPYIIKDYVTEVREIARVRRGIVDRFYVGRDPDAAHGIDKDASPATSVAFRAVLRQNIDGLVFLGDSVYTPEPSVAVGLRFFDKSLITSARRDVIDDVDKLLPPGMPPQHSMYVDRMRTSAQVLFLATCFVGSDFKTWWNINEQSTQQAMIVPAITAFTDLAKAAGHWQGVEQYLVSGTYLDEAIRQLNVFYNVTYKAIGAADGRAMVWR